LPAASPSRTTTPPASTSRADDGPPVGALPPGAYRSNIEPTFSFTVDAGWERRIPDERVSDRYLMLLWAAGDGGELIYVEVTDIGVQASLDRFATAQLSEKSPPKPASIGGVDGQTQEVGKPRSPSAIPGVVGEYVLTPTDVVRVTAVEVDDATITFILEANEDDAVAFWSIAEEVLASVSFD
jgi:hypothetical protein